LVSIRYPGQVTFTGHSLGGDLATVAAFSTGEAPAVTFNAKGTDLQDLETMPNAPWSPGEIHQYAQSHIIEYRTGNDPLTMLQERTPVVRDIAPDALGNHLSLPAGHDRSASGLLGTVEKPVEGHMINSLREAMDRDPQTYDSQLSGSGTRASQTAPGGGTW